MKRVYFDHNATTAVEPEVLEAMLPYFSEEFGNASSIHGFGQKARAAVETAREQVAALIGARPQEIVLHERGDRGGQPRDFWGGAGGSRRQRERGMGVRASGELQEQYPNRLQEPKAPHIITIAIEHEAVLNSCQELEKQGFAVTYLAVDRNGLVDPNEVRRALRAETMLTTVMHANNEIGTVQSMREIGEIAAEADVYFHTDAVQSAGKIPIDVNELKTRYALDFRSQDVCA